MCTEEQGVGCDDVIKDYDVIIVMSELVIPSWIPFPTIIYEPVPILILSILTWSLRDTRTHTHTHTHTDMTKTLPLPHMREVKMQVPYFSHYVQLKTCAILLLCNQYIKGNIRIVQKGLPRLYLDD